MNAAGFMAVAIGAVLGAWLRWGLSTYLNPAHPSLPLGTLAANLGGGYLIGVGVAFFAANASIAPEWRLACITGFLGALTTFSTFSAESMELLIAGRYGAAAIHSGAHLFGSLAATFLGFLTYRAIT
jgi:fluoride exporter